jgi:hypothetical protein
MGKEAEWPVTLNVHIEPEGLKRVVEEGRLTEFVGAFSSLAAVHIADRLVDQLARAGVGLTEVDRGVSIDIGFDVDDPYGTGPKPWPRPWPWPWPWISSVAIDTVPQPDKPFREWMRRIVREELENVGSL